MNHTSTSSASRKPGHSDSHIRVAAAMPPSWLSLLGDIARDHVSQIVFLVTGCVTAFVYTLLLPFDYTERVSFDNWQYLDAGLIAWSIVLGFGIAAVVILQVYAVRRVAAVRTRIGAVGGLAFIGSVLPSLLCCTPIIPTLLAFVGFSTIGIYGTTGIFQHFFATHQTQFFVGSIALIVLSAWWSIHRMAKATCLMDGCDINTTTSMSGTPDETLSATTGASR
ncbi:MAG: hypothetical protein ACP5OR_01985 [Candidatus Dormibacteria bacterium]